MAVALAVRAPAGLKPGNPVELAREEAVRIVRPNYISLNGRDLQVLVLAQKEMWMHVCVPVSGKKRAGLPPIPGITAFPDKRVSHMAFCVQGIKLPRGLQDIWLVGGGRKEVVVVRDMEGFVGVVATIGWLRGDDLAPGSYMTDVGLDIQWTDRRLDEGMPVEQKVENMKAWRRMAVQNSC